jgi:hypothetical protein
LTLLFACMAVATWLAEAADPTGRWWWASVVCVLRLASLFSMVNRGYSRTLLAPDRMQFSTLVRRRSIPCNEITRIEAAGVLLLAVRTVALTGLRTLGRTMPSSRAGRHVPLPSARGAGELAVRFATHRLRAAGARTASSIWASVYPSAFHAATSSSTDGTGRQPTVPSPHTPSLSRISAAARSSGHRGHVSTGQVAQVALARGPDADRVCGIGVTTRSGRSCARFRWSSRHRRSPAS